MAELLGVGLTGILLMMVTGGLVALVVLVIALGLRHQRRRRDAWQQAARALGGQGSVGHFTATVDGHGVRAIERTEGSGDSRTSYTDVDVAGPSGHIRIEPQGMLSGIFQGVDHEVGDPSVDDRFVIGGHPLALGLLDAETRHFLRNTQIKLTVAGGVLQLRRLGTVTDAETLEGLVRWAVAIARGLTAPDEELVDRLVHGVTHDPDVRVQRRFLEVLRDHAPDHARHAAQRVVDHPDPALRVAAASALGDVERLVVVVGHAQADEDVRIQAMHALAGTAAVGRGVFWAAAAPGMPRLWRAAAHVAQQGGGPELTEALVRFAPFMAASRWPQGREARARRVAAARELAKALGGVPGSESSEALLLVLLGHDDPDTRAAAIHSLSLVGSVAAVPSLTEAGSGFLSSLAGPAQSAIRAIQARAGGERGGLALAERPGGDLAVAEATERARRAARRTTEGPPRS